jgi:hypothetical protein
VPFYVAALVAAAVLPAPAAADTISCQTSAGGWFDPPMQSLSQRSGGTSGNYGVDTGGLIGRTSCVHHSVPDRTASSRITTRGTFTSTGCGTAVLTGDPATGASTIDLGGTIGPFVTQLSYTIELHEWHGILRVTQVNGRPEQGGDDVDGVFTFVPQHACIEAGVETYTLDGALSISW